MYAHMYRFHLGEKGVGYSTISNARKDLIGSSNNPHRKDLPFIPVASAESAYMAYDPATPWAQEVYGCPVRSTAHTTLHRWCSTRARE